MHHSESRLDRDHSGAIATIEQSLSLVLRAIARCQQRPIRQRAFRDVRHDIPPLPDADELALFGGAEGGERHLFPRIEMRTRVRPGAARGGVHTTPKEGGSKGQTPDLVATLQ